VAATRKKSNRSALRSLSRLLMQLMQRAIGSIKNIANQSTSNASTQNTSLRALTMAAMALPGLIVSPVYAAEGDEIDLQYGHYQEGDRYLAGVKSKYSPIESDSLHGSAKITLTDRLKAVVNYNQDTWSGATPIATAPSSANGNRLQYFNEIAGASPYLSSSLKLNSQFKPLKIDENFQATTELDNQLVHTLSSASPETRKQLDVKLSHEWDEFALDVGAGLSIERDYTSRFGNLGGRWDFNQKLTSLSAGLSYTSSTTKATLDHDAYPYIYGIYDFNGNNTYNQNHASSYIKAGVISPTLHGKREDWGTSIGLTQILNKNALIEANLGYTYSSGYLSNPYKVVEVAFIDPTQQFSGPDVYDAQLMALLEQRPDIRNQGTLNLRYVQHIEATDAALHLNYRYFQDDWGIKAHTFEAEWAQPLGSGWTVTPKLRYYSQDAADFYTPYLVTQQAFSANVIDPTNGLIYVNANTPNSGQAYYEDPTGTVTPPIDNDPASWNFGNPIVGSGMGAAIIDQATGLPVDSQALVDSLAPKTAMFDQKKLPKHYSSDHRLSGFGALSGGVTVSKQFSKAVSLEVGYEYYKHAGNLKLGGGGEGSYADFNYSTLNAALKIDLNAVGYSSGSSDSGYSDTHSHHAHSEHNQHSSHAPAGVMFDHMLSNADDFMISYHYMYSHQAGSMLNGSDTVGDQAILNNGCNGNVCYVKPTEMNMHMHMLDIMYAPTDWLNLMIMPQYIDMNMSMSPVNGAPFAPDGMGPIGSAVMHADHPHTTGGVGDTGLYAMFKLIDNPSQHLHASLGLSVPTGDVGIKLRDVMQQSMGFTHYGMQLGSGTWDLKPSLTYIAEINNWSWGAQLSGTKRLEDKNSSGFALGDEIQSTAWLSRNIINGLSASVRGVYTWQGDIKGGYDSNIPAQIGPMDYTNNYGGRFWDVGLGLTAVMHGGSLDGNKLSVEWLQPVKDNVNGYQLERKGSLAINWSMMF
jgi:hypothetical protein